MAEEDSSIVSTSDSGGSDEGHDGEEGLRVVNSKKNASTGKGAIRKKNYRRIKPCKDSSSESGDDGTGRDENSNELASDIAKSGKKLNSQTKARAAWGASKFDETGESQKTRRKDCNRTITLGSSSDGMSDAHNDTDKENSLRGSQESAKAKASQHRQPCKSNAKDLAEEDASNSLEGTDHEFEAEGSNSSDISTSSDSISEAQHPLNELNIQEPALDTSSCASSIEEQELRNHIVTGRTSTRFRTAEMTIHSGTEFSVAIFTTHAQTHRRIYQYPEEFVNKFLAIPPSFRRFEDGQFIFKTTLKTFAYVKRIINEHWKRLDLDSIANVIFALVKYHHVTDDYVLEKTGHKYAELRISQFTDLRPYQRESISFAHLRQGRCMLADTSGMGKRVEAIVICYLFEEEWPVIIICSTSQQKHWLMLLQRWLPTRERRYTVEVLETSEDCDDYLNYKTVPDFTIIGYKLLGKEAKRLKTIEFKISVIDESHKIKHEWTATAKAARQIIKRAKRRLLLTSNPAFGVPDELFYQLHVIDRNAFKEHNKFADRYCGYERRFDAGSGLTKEYPSRSWKTAKNHDELKHLLHNTVMIRHSKSDDTEVLQPVKIRKLIELDFQPDERTKKILGEIYLESKSSLDNLILDSQSEKKAKVFIWFKKSGKAKMNLICKYLDQLDMHHRKIIIYARHIFVLDGIEELLKRKRIGYVRIRGDYEVRRDLSSEFNDDGKIKVALLSLNISQIGVNLTKADMVIFTELYWVPDSILRNEDRAWEFFQQNETNDTTGRANAKEIEIIYLIANELGVDLDKQVHMDLHLWEMLVGKVDTLLKLGLIEDNFPASIRKEVFQPIPSTFDDDLKFSDISSNEDDSEYIQDDDLEVESETETSPCGTSDLSIDENDSSDNNCDKSSQKSPMKRSSPHTPSQRQVPDILEQPGRRLTRSQSAPAEAVLNQTDNDNSSNDSSNNEGGGGDADDESVESHLSHNSFITSTEGESDETDATEDSEEFEREVKRARRSYLN